MNPSQPIYSPVTERDDEEDILDRNNYISNNSIISKYLSDNSLTDSIPIPFQEFDHQHHHHQHMSMSGESLVLSDSFSPAESVTSGVFSTISDWSLQDAKAIDVIFSEQVLADNSNGLPEPETDPVADFNDYPIIPTEQDNRDKAIDNSASGDNINDVAQPIDTGANAILAEPIQTVLKTKHVRFVSPPTSPTPGLHSAPLGLRIFAPAVRIAPVTTAEITIHQPPLPAIVVVRSSSPPPRSLSLPSHPTLPTPPTPTPPTPPTPTGQSPPSPPPKSPSTPMRRSVDQISHSSPSTANINSSNHATFSTLKPFPPTSQAEFPPPPVRRSYDDQLSRNLLATPRYFSSHAPAESTPTSSTSSSRLHSAFIAVKSSIILALPDRKLQQSPSGAAGNLEPQATSDRMNQTDDNYVSPKVESTAPRRSATNFRLMFKRSR